MIDETGNEVAGVETDAQETPAGEGDVSVGPVDAEHRSDVEPGIAETQAEHGILPYGDANAAVGDGVGAVPVLNPADYALQETGFYAMPVEPTVRRTPNFLDSLIFLMLAIAAFVVTTLLTAAAVFLHWFGLLGFEDATKKTSVSLAVQVLLYVLLLAIAVPVFRAIWGRGYFGGLHWHARAALRRWYWLLPVAIGCNLMAALGDKLLPFPEHAPIDQMFKTSNDAWMLALFGVTIAPFFEEMIFRGFLLPAVATAWDWCLERITGANPRALDAEGNPQWSAAAMVIGSLVVSAPFALMHSPQLGHAWGPLVLLYCVSLALCATRLVTRSLAASTLVHSMYNFMLFAVMFAQTDGFKHMDKM
jgi:uncharacterized protein